MNRFVFDTNAIVSALLLSNSVPRQALDRALDIGKILVSDSIITELGSVLARDRFDRYITQVERLAFLDALLLESEMVDVTESIRACPDPDDDRILELAVSGRADCIVTGDSDLLLMTPFRGVEILTPAGFLVKTGASTGPVR